MKDKRAFTLIELLVTVALIAIISIAVGVSVGNLMTKQKHKNYDKFVENMEEAACVFMQNDNRTEGLCQAYTSLCDIHFKDLINSGLVKKNEENPMTGETVANDYDSYVHVEYVDGERICTFVDRKCTDAYCQEKE